MTFAEGLVRGEENHRVEIPIDAKPGGRLWFEFEGAWIDFTVMPLADLQLALEENELVVTMQSNLDHRRKATVSVGDQRTDAPLDPATKSEARLDLGAPTREDLEVVTVGINSGKFGLAIQKVIRTTVGFRQLAGVPEAFAMGIRLRGKEETTDVAQTRAYIAPGRSSCDMDEKDGWMGHPPWSGAVGYSYATFGALTVPDVECVFRATVGKKDGSDPGDGMLYKAAVVEQDGTETIIGEQLVEQHEWLTLEGDLTPWRGQEVRIKMIVDVGEDDNSTGDWACWAEMRIETPTAVLTRVLEDDAERYRREAGPYPIDGLSVADLKAATSGFMRYDGCGLSGGTGDYGSDAVVNGIEIGPMIPAGGNERDGVWIEAVGVPLTAEAIATLQRRNTFALSNPKRDHFKVRRFWLELELADGRQCSSDISTGAFTQPPGWPYAEGVGVPHGEDIEVDVWFDVEE